MIGIYSVVIGLQSNFLAWGIHDRSCGDPRSNQNSAFGLIALRLVLLDEEDQRGGGAASSVYGGDFELIDS